MKYLFLLSEHIFIVKLKDEEIKLKCVHLITHHGLLIGTQYIQTDNHLPPIEH